MNKYHTLRNYLIRKFMVTIILVSVAEFAITALLNNSLFPFAMHFFFPEANMEMLSVGGMMMAFLVVFVSVFSTILQAILPAQLVFFINSLSDNVFHAFGANQEHVIEQLGILKEIMLLLVLFGFLALIIAPYIIAAVYLKTEAVYPFELYIALHVKIHVCSGVFGELVAKQGDDIINFLGGLGRTEDSSVIAVLISRH